MERKQEGLEILHQEGRGQVNIIVMEHFKSILFHNSGPANMQYNYQLGIRVKSLADILLVSSLAT